MRTWIDRREMEPTAFDGVILVWAENTTPPHWNNQVVACRYDYETWVDVIDGNDIGFRYWKPAPPSPYQEPAA